jgi:two-component system response regulator YesN
MKKILLLDDDMDLCLLMGMALKDLGVVEYSYVNSYEEFVSLPPERYKVDVFFLDINLGFSSKTGIDAFDWLREHHPESNIIFFTGHAHNFPELQTRLKFPKVQLLQKPLELVTLEQIINKI